MYDGVEVQQWIQLVDNGGYGRGAQRAQDGICKLWGTLAMARGKCADWQTGRRTTALALAEGQDPVGQAVGQGGLPMGIAEAHVGVHNHVALILATRVFRVALVEAVCAHGGGGAERMHVGWWAGKLGVGVGVGVGQRACHCGAREGCATGGLAEWRRLQLSGWAVLCVLEATQVFAWFCLVVVVVGDGVGDGGSSGGGIKMGCVCVFLVFLHV